MQIDWWTLGLQALNALVLIWILARFFFRPVSEIMRARQAEADAILHDAEAAKQAAQTAQDEARAETKRLADERADVLDNAAREAEKAKDATLEDARKQAEKIRADAKASVEALREKQKADLSVQAGHLAVEVAEKLLSRLPQDALVSGFVAGLGEGIAGLPEETRNGIGAGGEAIRLRVARELDDAENEACKRMLQHVLGKEVRFEVIVDPALIAGLELEASHALVRNSFRADLERIEAELTRHA